MTKILFVVFATLAFSSMGQCASMEGEVREVVSNFYKEYMEFSRKPMKGDSDAQLINWVSSSPYVSQEFKLAFKRTIFSARKEDPELGLDYDPIVDAQDYPDKGFPVKEVKIFNKKAIVTMEGIDWSDFHVAVELVSVKDKWLINGIGHINRSAK
jgi:hypothetical protein